MLRLMYRFSGVMENAMGFRDFTKVHVSSVFSIYAYRHVAKCGWRWWEIDMTWWAITLLKSVGLATNINLSPEQAMKV